jgi:hypothetical protein
LGINPEYNTSSIPAISTIWSTPGTEFFTEEADTPPPSITSFDVNTNFINKVHKTKKPRTGLFVKQGKLTNESWLCLCELSCALWIYAHPFTIFANSLIAHSAINLGEKGKVASHTNVYPRMDASAELPNNDIACSDEFTGKDFHTAPLARTIPPVTTRPLSFLMGHGLPS